MTTDSSPGASDFLLFAKWEAMLAGASLLRPDLYDATEAYANFLSNTGNNWYFSYERFVRHDRAGSLVLKSVLQDAAVAALHLHDVSRLSRFKMQTGGIAVGANDQASNPRFPYPGTENWQKAIGAHALWIEADVGVAVQGGTRHLEVDMTLHAEDRYNFNPYNNDIRTKIKDEENGRFELTGLAREFMSYSTMRRQMSFDFSAEPRPTYRSNGPTPTIKAPR